MLRSLKKFVFIEDAHCSPFDYSVFSQTPNLSSFLLHRKHDALIHHNKDAIQCLESLKIDRPKYLKYIGIFENESAIKKFIKSKKVALCNKSESEQLCNLLISLTSSAKENNVEIIELNSVVLKQKEMQYLHFWFVNKYSGLEANIHKKQRQNSYYLHLKCWNNS